MIIVLTNITNYGEICRNCHAADASQDTIGMGGKTPAFLKSTLGFDKHKYLERFLKSTLDFFDKHKYSRIPFGHFLKSTLASLSEMLGGAA